MTNIIVKFGGSFFSDKTAKTGVIRQDNLVRLATIVTELRKEAELQLVFGAGSFGHGLAEELGLKTDEFTKVLEHDLAPLEASLCELQQLITTCLPPDVEVYFAGLEKKGDMVRIVSGDEIIVNLVDKAKPLVIIFYGDVQGVKAGGKLYEEFRTSDLPQIIATLAEVESDKIDVTGAMRGKLIQLSKLKSPTIIKFRT